MKLTALLLCSWSATVTYGQVDDVCYTEGAIDITITTDSVLTTGSMEVVFPRRFLSDDSERELDTWQMTERLARTLGVAPGQLLVAFNFDNFDYNNTVTASFQLLAVDTDECPIPCFGRWSDWSENASPCGAIDAWDMSELGNSQRTFIVVEPGNDAGAACSYPNNTLQNGTCCAGHWSQWSECAVSCGTGSRWRQFNLTVPAENLGRELTRADQNHFHQAFLHLKRRYQDSSSELTLWQQQYPELVPVQ